MTCGSSASTAVPDRMPQDARAKMWSGPGIFACAEECLQQKLRSWGHREEKLSQGGDQEGGGTAWKQNSQTTQGRSRVGQIAWGQVWRGPGACVGVNSAGDRDGGSAVGPQRGGCASTAWPSAGAAGMPPQPASSAHTAAPAQRAQAAREERRSGSTVQARRRAPQAALQGAGNKPRSGPLCQRHITLHYGRAPVQWWPSVAAIRFSTKNSPPSMICLGGCPSSITPHHTCAKSKQVQLAVCKGPHPAEHPGCMLAQPMLQHAWRAQHSGQGGTKALRHRFRTTAARPGRAPASRHRDRSRPRCARRTRWARPQGCPRCRRERPAWRCRRGAAAGVAAHVWQPSLPQRNCTATWLCMLLQAGSGGRKRTRPRATGFRCPLPWPPVPPARDLWPAQGSLSAPLCSSWHSRRPWPHSKPPAGEAE